jgi:polysaccharide biosynthesis protein PslJ
MTAVAAPTRSTSIDAVTGLTAFLVLLIVIPSRLIFAPLGSAGTPAEVLGMVLFAVWLTVYVSSLGRREKHPEPIKIFAGLFVGAVLISYVAANTRAMFSAEARAADSGLLLVCSWMGVMLMAMDRVPTRERLDVLLRRLVLLAGALATLGLLQFVTKMPFTNYLQVPGLANNQTLSVYGRGGLTRPAGTASHPIEFGAVLTMALPIAMHYAMIDRHRPALRRWYPVLAMGIAVPISISRSAVISLIVVLCFVLPTWTRAARRRAYAAILALFGAVYVMVPGLLGTITHLFTGISGDSSAQSRSGSFSLAYDFISRTPIFGRGFLTFLPAYRILDDQYLGLLIETGVVGLLAYLALLVSGVVGGLRVRRTANQIDGLLGVSLAASVASALASFALFDAFSFPMAASLSFLVLGCVGALSRLARTPSADIRRETPSPA